MRKIFWIDRNDKENGDEWKEYINENQLLIAIEDPNDFRICKNRLEKNRNSKIEVWEKDFDVEDTGYFYFEIIDIKNEEEKNTIVNFIEKYSNEKLSDVLDVIDTFAKRITRDLTLNDLEGSIGEALFIEKCINSNLGEEIFNFCNQKTIEEDRIDFVIKDKKFEIKTTSRQKSEINITDKQISESPNIVVVSVEFSNKGTTIFDIYNRIRDKWNGKLPLSLQIKEIDYKNKADFVNNLAINENQPITFNFFDNSKLPKVENIEYSEYVKKITYTLSIAFNNPDILFDEQLKNIINS